MMMRFPFLICILLVMAGACARVHDNHDHDHEAADLHDEAEMEAPHHDDDGEESHDKGTLVVMSREAVEAAGISTLTISPQPFREAVKVAGVIENAVGNERIIAAPASGIVSFSSGIVAGQTVRAGQSLFSISSRGLEQADATATLHVEAEAARKAFERAETLIKDNLITRTEYDRLRAEYDRARAAAATVAAKTARAVAVAAPVAGFLINVSVSPGAFVNMGEPLATVAASRRLLLRADVSERHRNFASSVSGANIRIPGDDRSFSLESLSPRVLSSSPSAAADSHFFPVYIEFDNPGGLASGSVVETWLLGVPRNEVLAVPSSALVEEGGYFYVYVKIPDEHEIFRKTEVKSGASDGLRTEILGGIAPGDNVVVSGAQRIRMAGMGSAIHGHSHHH